MKVVMFGASGMIGQGVLRECLNDARVEQVLAVTSRSSIGYAAYYAATREYPDRLVTLRHKNRTVVRSSGPGH